MIGYDMTSKDPSKWGSSGRQQLAGPGMPVAAAAGPAPVRENSILLIGGDKRGNSPDPSRPVVQSRDILVYDVIGNTWLRPSRLSTTLWHSLLQKSMTSSSMSIPLVVMVKRKFLLWIFSCSRQ